MQRVFDYVRFQKEHHRNDTLWELLEKIEEEDEQDEDDHWVGLDLSEVG
jgi:hypothetical protein